MKLNVACFKDPWGDVRVDIAGNYHNLKTKANVYADAQKLPFRDMAFEETKAWNILEHLPQWKNAIREWCRVTEKKLEIEVPIDAGFENRELITGMLCLNYPLLLDLPNKRREHLWKFNPNVIIQELNNNGFSGELCFEWAPFLFRDNNRLTKYKIIKLIREKEMKIKFGYRIVSYRNQTAT